MGSLPPRREASHAGVPQQPANSSSVCSTRNAAEDLQEQRKKPHPEGGGHRHKSIPGQWCNSPNRSRFTTNNQPSHRHYEVAHIRIFGSLTQRPSIRMDGQATTLLFVSIWSNHGIKTVVKIVKIRPATGKNTRKLPLTFLLGIYTTMLLYLLVSTMSRKPENISKTTRNGARYASTKQKMSVMSTMPT